MRSRKVRMTGLLVGLLALGMFASGSPAGAVSPLPIICNLQATIQVTPGTGPGPQDWRIDMAGDCSGDLEGPYFAVGSARGTSVGSGFCGGLVVRDLNLDAVLSLQSLNKPAFNKVLLEKWTAGITTWPIATPFFINGVVFRPTRPATASTGLGVLFNRLRGPLGGCPGSAGSSDAGITLTIRTT